MQNIIHLFLKFSFYTQKFPVFKVKSFENYSAWTLKKRLVSIVLESLLN